MLTGHINTGAVTQDIAAGGEVFLRSVQQPGFYTVQNPYDPSGIVQDGAVYTYVGSENIYQPIAPLPAPEPPLARDPLESAGPRRLWEDSHQASAVIQDRMHLPGRIQLIAGGRYDSLHDHNYSPYASCTDFSVPGASQIHARRTHEQARLAAAIRRHLQPDPEPHPLLELRRACCRSVRRRPFWTDNGSQFLAPFFTRQAEVGAKYEPGQRILLTAAFFHMRAPFFYPKVIQADSFCPAGGSGDLCFESEGRETHNGVELNAEGKAANWLRLNGSAAAMNATSPIPARPPSTTSRSSTCRTCTQISSPIVTVPRLRGLHLMPGWSFASRKEATRDDAVSVPSYNLFNLGARYTPGGEQGRVTFRIYADNITNKRYWSDTGASYGDTFIWLGAPATVRLSAHYTF